VPRMEQIEDAVGECDGSPLRCAPRLRVTTREDLARWVEAPAQNGPDAFGLNRISRTKPGNSMLW
jgi:hypothetical protein